MSFTGLAPATADYQPFIDNISSGLSQLISAQGVRANISAATNGDDIWSGTATTIPIPASAGEQMTVASTSASDTLLGTGGRKVEIHYIDANGLSLSEIINMSGTTPVNTVATNIRFINEFYIEDTGSSGAAVGTISIYKTGAAATVYSVINAGHFKTANSSRMVPAGKVCLIDGFIPSGGAAAGGKSAQVSLRATAHHGILLPVSPTPIFHKMATAFIYNSAVPIALHIPIDIVPALAVIKCTAWTASGGADVAADWYGRLVSAPV